MCWGDKRFIESQKIRDEMAATVRQCRENARYCSRRSYPFNASANMADIATERECILVTLYLANDIGVRQKRHPCRTGVYKTDEERAEKDEAAEEVEALAAARS